MRCSRFILTVCACLLAGATVAGAQSKPTDLQAQQRQLRQTLSASYRRMGSLGGEHALRDLFKLSIVDGRLTAAVHPPTTLPVNRAQNVRVNIRGLPDFSMLMLMRDGGQMHFSLNNINVSDPRAVRIDTHIDYSEDQLSIVRSVQQATNGTRFLNISLTQGSPAMIDDEPGAAGVRLYVNSNSGRGALVEAEIYEPDFAALRRNHPAAVQKYVRPVLRELGFEDIFDVDVALARQVFSAEWPADAAVAARVAALVVTMDSDSFRQREAAIRQLEALGPEGALAAYQVERSQLSPEQNAQLDSFLAGRAGISPAEAQRMQGDREFLLDCLTSEEAMLRKIALAHLERSAGRKIEFDVAAAGERRRGAAAALRSALMPPSTSPSSIEE